MASLIRRDPRFVLASAICAVFAATVLAAAGATGNANASTVDRHVVCRCRKRLAADVVGRVRELPHPCARGGDGGDRRPASRALPVRRLGPKGDCVGTASACLLSVDTDLVVHARFASRQVMVGATVSGPGTIRSDPPGIVCGTGRTPDECQAPFDEGTVVRFTADGGAAASFAQWDVGCQGSQLTCDLPVFPGLQNEVVAAFKSSTPLPGVTIKNIASQVLSVTSRPGVACPPTCQVPAGPATAAVRLVATPPAATDQVRWTGGCVGVVPVCPVVGGAGQPVGVTYVESTVTSYGLNLTPCCGGAITGTVSGDDARIRCDFENSTQADCTLSFPPNAKIMLQASPG